MGQRSKRHATRQSKPFSRKFKYDSEIACFERLDGVQDIGGLAVPFLIDFDASLMVVEMSIVDPPCIVDFGKCYLDIPPEYWRSKATMEQWECDLGRALRTRDADCRNPRSKVWHLLC